MLRKFSIHEEGKKPVAFLYYDDHLEEYSIKIINRDLQVAMPAILYFCVKNKKYELNPKESMTFIREHIIPSDRAGMDYILKQCGFPYYKEIFFIEKFRGRNVMDDFLIDEIITDDEEMILYYK